MSLYWKHSEDMLGLSTESKPTTGVVDGTTFYEVDTTDFYIFYKGTWYLQGTAAETVSDENE